MVSVVAVGSSGSAQLKKMMICVLGFTGIRQLIFTVSDMALDMTLDAATFSYQIQVKPLKYLVALVKPRTLMMMCGWSSQNGCIVLAAVIPCQFKGPRWETRIINILVKTVENHSAVNANLPEPS